MTPIDELLQKLKEAREKRAAEAKAAPTATQPTIAPSAPATTSPPLTKDTLVTILQDALAPLHDRLDNLGVDLTQADKRMAVLQPVACWRNVSWKWLRHR